MPIDHDSHPIDGLTIREAKRILPLPIMGDFFMRVLTLRTYNQFVTLVHDMIDFGIKQIQQNPQHHQDRGEEALTDAVIQPLRGFGFSAGAETSQGGHCDIVIGYRNWVWLGEAKIYNQGYGYLQKGVNQLFSRYSTGETGEDRGGVIIYIRTPKASNVMRKWRAATEKRVDCSITEDCQLRPGLAFISHHPEHPRSGLPYYIRHMAVMLHYAPDDTTVCMKA